MLTTVPLRLLVRHFTLAGKPTAGHRGDAQDRELDSEKAAEFRDNACCSARADCPADANPSARKNIFVILCCFEIEPFQRLCDSGSWRLSCRVKGMMHYYMHDGPAAFRFELAGELDADDAARLEQDWRTASSIVGNRTLIVDMSFVTGIEDAVRHLFQRWHDAGAEFVANSRQSRELVESITGRPFAPQLPHSPTYQSWISLSLTPLVPLLALLIFLTPSQANAADDDASLAFARFVTHSAVIAPSRSAIVFKRSSKMPTLNSATFSAMCSGFRGD